MSTANGEANELRSHSTGELVKQLSEQTTTLVRKEIELARAELTAKGKVAGEGAGMFGGAAVAGLLALGTLTVVILALLDKAMDLWVAALIVTLVYGAVAAVLAMRGRDRVKEGMPPAPEQTVETVKEDVQWAKTKAKSARR
ncbi:MAG TPA: phage holin family protein [Solirubrobacterales bacterium]|nr:phage holin family protein [Solirubrobacterales bacterium]